MQPHSDPGGQITEICHSRYIGSERQYNTYLQVHSCAVNPTSHHVRADHPSVTRQAESDPPCRLHQDVEGDGLLNDIEAPF